MFIGKPFRSFPFLTLLFGRLSIAYAGFIFPTTPTETESPTEIESPTESPASTSFLFDGLDRAYSVRPWEVALEWDAAYDTDGNFLTTCTYDLFVADETYNFTNVLEVEGTSIPDLIQIFNKTADLYHFPYENALRMTELKLDAKEDEEYLLQLMMTAVCDGSWDVLNNYTIFEVWVSTIEPKLKDGVEILGTFFPSDSISIVLEEISIEEEYGFGDLDVQPTHTLTFTATSGELASSTQSLQAGNNIKGMTSTGNAFVRTIDSVTSSSATSVVLEVKNLPIEEMFESLQLYKVIDVEENFYGDDPVFNEYNNTFGNQEFLNIFIDMNDRNDSMEIITDKSRYMKTNEVKKFFETNLRMRAFPKRKDGQQVDTYTKSITKNLNDYTKIEGQMVIKKTLHYRIDVGKKLAVCKFSLGVKLRTELVFTPKNFADNGSFTIVKIPSKTIIFWIWFLPIPVTFQPEFKLNWEYELEFSGDAEARFGLEIGTTKQMELGGRVDSSSGFQTIWQAPEFGHEIIGPDITGSATLTASTNLQVGLTTDVFFGAIAVKISGKIGPQFEIMIGFQKVGANDDNVLKVDTLDVKLVLEVPMKVFTVFFGGVNLYDGNLFEKTWYIISLPNVSIVFVRNSCTLGGGTDGSNLAVVEFSTQVNNNPNDAFITNGISATGSTWYLDDADWNTPDVTNGIATTSHPGSTSPTMTGSVTVTVVPKFPGFPLLPMLVTGDASNLITSDATCA